ncbi:type II secretion system F family protein [Catellatospora chokoriensis]|uniref:Flp pilus assembly protein TadB n=1 Tax=Catellatospora chokoriensis TaxID=310353 RepID=A0A8J3NRB8_9ACTN|nr:type II secretion protein F [Catellatospora chokoriensis]GIF89785.1 hypothetical protein Cch02nite_32290 [Catellatospora chokoriensis]
MTALAALLGAVTGLGLALAMAALLAPSASVPPPRRAALTQQQLIRMAVALAAAVLVGAVTRWPVGALLSALAVYALPVALGGDRGARQALARTEAVATWAEMLRDNLSAATGLEQTIVLTAPYVPEAIRPQVADLAAAVRLGQRLPAALDVLRERIDDRTGRLVVRALSQASQRQSRQLAELLTELAGRARSRASLRLRIAPGHARIRTNARIIVGFTLAMAAGLALARPAFLAPYDDALGQLVLLVVGAAFAAGLTGIARLARVGTDERSPR